MNISATLAQIHLKENSFYSHVFLTILKADLSIFISSWLPDGTKPKIEEEIRNFYIKNKIYEAQLKAIGCIKDIEMSHVLGCNEIVLPILAEEYANLFNALRDVVKKLQLLKPYNATQAGVECIIGSINKDGLYDLLVKDITTLSLSFSSQKAAINTFKTLIK